jgi:diguanylate cyclase (GGDEF)-like protein
VAGGGSRPKRVAFGAWEGRRAALTLPAAAADTNTMGPSLESLTHNKKLMAYTAAAMYGGATLDGAIEGLIPGDPSFALAPLFVAALVVPVLVILGPGLPRWALACLGPLGVVLIAYALSAVPGAGDGAVLYMWPVLWTTFFFGRRGAVAIVLWIGLAHAVTLLMLPDASSYPGRWIDVMVSVSVVAVVVLTLTARNDELLTRLAGEARVDALTGLLNRRGFDERAAIELAHARREQGWVAVATFDLDYFKRINDEWGHDIGDRALARTAALLREQAREIDLIARFGGEEFVVLMPGNDAAGAKAFAERVRAALAAADSSGLPTVRVSAGVDAAVAPENVSVLLGAADSALYNAKRAGRDRVVVFEHGGRDRAAEVTGSAAFSAILR